MCAIIPPIPTPNFIYYNNNDDFLITSLSFDASSPSKLFLDINSKVCCSQSAILLLSSCCSPESNLVWFFAVVNCSFKAFTSFSASVALCKKKKKRVRILIIIIIKNYIDYYYYFSFLLKMSKCKTNNIHDLSLSLSLCFLPWYPSYRSKGNF